MNPTSETNLGPPSEVKDKYCELSKSFEPHEPHPWGEQEFPYWCRGILPVNEQARCQMIVGSSKKTCGMNAPITVRVRTALIDGDMWVCADHKSKHDSRSARLRRRAS